MDIRSTKRQKREDGADVVAAAARAMEMGVGSQSTAASGFIPSDTFRGAKSGYFFSRGPAGQGYYPDPHSKKPREDRSAVRAKKPEATAPSEPLDAAKLLEHAEKEHAAEADAQIEVLDVRGLKKIVLAFERKLKDNLEARMKYAENPDRFLDSEVELDEEIKKMHALATAPHLYPELVKLKSVPSILGMLSHDNTDIAVDTVAVLNELTDGDVIEECKEEAQALVDELLENNALELLVQNLARLDESVPEEAQGVFNTLGVVENMMEVKPEVGELALGRTKLLKWLLHRVRAKEFDTNKFYASEILSILMQGSESNQKKLGGMNGVDALLQAAAMYKGKEPQMEDEAEMVENVFDALCWAVMPPENKQRFVQAEGVELMILIIKNKKFCRLSAIKALDFALTRCPAGCERFVEVLGLKVLFGTFMGKAKQIAGGRRKMTAEELEEEEQRAVSILASVFLGLSRGSKRDRVGAKFVESEFEKVDRLVELFIKYRKQVTEAEKTYRQELEEDEEEEDEEELLSTRMDAGLFTLQLVALIAGNIWSFGHDGIRNRMRMLLRQNDLSLHLLRDVLQEHHDSIGDGDGVEERDRRRKRIAKLLMTMYEDGEQPTGDVLPSMGEAEPEDAAAAPTEDPAEPEDERIPAADS
ncbi:hypothetical protein CYMTET_49893 [Cymbomonas tetramitiformis]|uniref:Beta-catenin-like protein 1 N-terminal domain-containing protein n=1 Tax=Cymbomonas tetramitiformis TaxID=36881 RepID=A0AAE0BPA7_9CHLO|nr:hypothetical protein CYMTET_49893 [Cymbomonas tetramitiformis]